MKLISLNHTLNPAHSRPIPNIFLFISVAILLISLFFLQRSSVTLQQLKNEQSEYSRSVDSNSVALKLTEKEQTELDAVKAAISEIVMPWPRLFSALEVSRLQTINVLSVEPNLRAKSFHITAVTYPVEEILMYITQLKQQEEFTSVSLISTETVRVDGKNATQFELLVLW
ncbi:hypothetical protein E8Q33_08810 [Methylophaga sp. SB9B]|uniref:hypothetical protein n=1 Tax=Methylophaga sp. SB9B TaxID=2570356 RepID=UPI0010A910AC|nr:hypothetical protein [Methylophaga sp. SB9B]THK41210.1 hypothetical protein E8Q33_08810 [Methylophaga sp. SB9B]